MHETKAVYTLKDLESWTSREPQLAVLGHPIKHSLSPVMHNAALQHFAAEKPELAAWHYKRFDVTPEELPQALKALQARGFVGLNLTVPHKVLACDLVAGIDRSAEGIGAVNTLVSTPEGWRGYNTDGYGLYAGIKQDLGIDLQGQSVLLLGAGGAARGAAVECLRRGVKKLVVMNRSRANLEALVATLNSFKTADCTVLGLTPEEDKTALGPESLVINATSLGLKPEDPAPVDLQALPRPKAVFDMVYNPPKTRLLADASALGLPCSNGLSMLVNQGAKALSLWTGLDSERLQPVMARALKAQLV